MLRGCVALGRLRGAAASCGSVGSPAAALQAVWSRCDDAAAVTTQFAAGAATLLSRGFAVPSHMPDPSEKWPEGRRAAEGWWEDPAISTAAQAFEIFDASLEKHRHLRQRHVQEIIKRCNDADDLQLAVNAMDKLMRFRRAEQLHKPFNAHTGKMLAEQAIAVRAPEVAAKAFGRSAELGLTPGTIQVFMVAKQLGMQGKFEELLRLLSAAQAMGIRTTPNMAYTVALTAVQVGQAERGRDLVKEMELNGVRIRAVIWEHLDKALSSGSEATAAAADSTGDSVAETDAETSAETPNSANGGSSGASATSSAAAKGDASEEPSGEQKAKEGATPEAAAGLPPGVAS